ncbi:MAG TPA: TonB-dependent siderophore receptor [Burkholderiaceae bacterium]|jgi:catecholate siderophore receptor
MNRRTPIASALLALFAAPAAWSQVSAVTAPAPQAAAAAAETTLPPVLVQGSADRGGFTSSSTSLNKLAPDLRDVPQSVTVLNKTLLQSQGATSLADALHNVPGITLGGAEGGQIGNNINLNGFAARTDIYLDGFRDRGQYFRDTFALDSVEVLMGPSSMLFGRGSTGGVINQVTKKPSLKASTEISASVTTNGLVRTTIDVNHPIDGESALRVAAMAQDGKPTTRDEMKNRDFGVAPSLRMGIGTPTEITLSALIQHNHDMPDYGVSPLNGRPVQVDRNTFYGYTDDRTIQDVAAFTAAIEHKISPTITLRNQTQYNDVRVNAVETASQGIGTVPPVSQLPAGQTPPPGYSPLTTAGISSLPLNQLSVRLQSHDRVIHDKSLFNQTDVSARFDSGTIKHNVIGGVELGHDSYLNRAYSRTGSCAGTPLPTGYVGCEPVIDPSYSASPVTTSTAGNVATSTANTVAAYANDTVELNPQFKLVGGLRYDNYQATVNNTVTSATTLARVQQTVNFTSVRLGGIWQPSDTQSYYLSYSTSFNPSLEQLTNTTGVSVLAPEKNRAYELGGKWDVLGGKASFNAAAFQITQFNARSQQSDGTFLATGTIRVNGARLGASGELAKGWKVFAGYAYLDAKIIDGIAAGTTGMAPSNTPKQSATLWSTYEFAPHWELGGGATYLSSRYLNNTDTVQVDGYTRLDATLAYRTKAYDIRLNLFNLANKYYYDALIQSDGGRAVPGTGRSAMLSFTYHI